MLATLVVTVDDATRYDSGATTIKVLDAAGEGRVYAFATVALDHQALRSGQRIRATGIVGQRASSSGAADGYRLWLRGSGDLQLLGDAPGSTPAPTADPGDDSGTGKPPRVRIAEARPGSIVTIVGTVTSKAGFIDSEGRRVTVQDRSGAILVRYPADAKPAAVGRTIRTTGEVGTWYGTRQLEAASTPKRKGRARVKPATLSHPPTEVDEWRLVKAWLTITEVARDGDTGRAEATLRSGVALPVAGLAGAGIDGQLLEPGRRARITGIVRRAHPSASDQRFALAPRSRKDIRLGELIDDPHDGDGDDGGDDDDDDDIAAWGPNGIAADGVVAATLVSLAGLDERVVRVGGRVTAITEQRLTLDDGTASGVVRIPQAVVPISPELQLGEVVNATGRVKRRTGGRREVVVDSAADIRRAAMLGFAQGAPISGEVGEALQPIAAIHPAPMSGPSQPTTNGDHGLVLWLVSGALAAAAGLLALAAFAVGWLRRQTWPAATARSRPSPGPRAPSAG